MSAVPYPARRRSAPAAFRIAVSLMCAAPAVVAGDPVLLQVEPGGRVAFEEPDVVEGSFDGPDLAAFMDAAPPRAFAYGFLPLQSAAARVMQGHAFELPDSQVVGAAGGHVVAAQIAGCLDVRGFLFAAGAGSGSATVVVNLRDVTDVRAPVLVASHAVADYRVDCEVGVAISGETQVGGEAGFPYAGASASGGIGAEVGLAPQLQVVHDRLEFAFEAPLRRGADYRIEIELSTEVSLRLLGGQVIASFFSPLDGGPVLPNPFDPEGTVALKGAETSWLDVLRPMAGSLPNLGMRKGEADVVGRTVDVGAGSLEFGSIWDQSISDVLNPFGFLDGGQSAKLFRAHDVLDALFTTPPLDVPTLLGGSAFLKVENDGRREFIESPGVHLSELTLTLDHDRIELAERATNERIEDALVRRQRVVGLYLPEAHGGQLERALALVEQLVGQTEAAGLDVSGARKLLDDAQLAAANGKAKKAWDLLCSAYRRLAVA